jgi:hypothetical protein
VTLTSGTKVTDILGNYTPPVVPPIVPPGPPVVPPLVPPGPPAPPVVPPTPPVIVVPPVTPPSAPELPPEFLPPVSTAMLPLPGVPASAVPVFRPEAWYRPAVALAEAAPRGLGEEERGAISGTVFFDDNYDGVRDRGEPGLYLQEVVLEQQGDDGRLERIATARTDANGWYIFMGLKPGLYRVRARFAPQYVQTTEADEYGVYVVTIRDSFHAMNRDFGAVYSPVAYNGRAAPPITHLVHRPARDRDDMFEHWAGPTIGGDGAREEAAFLMDFSVTHASSTFRRDEAFISRVSGPEAVAGLALGALLVSQTAPHQEEERRTPRRRKEVIT